VICPPYSNLATYNNTLTNWTAEIPRSDNLNSKVVGGRNTIVSPGRYNCQTNSIENPFENMISIYPTITSDMVQVNINSNDKYFLYIYNALGIQMKAIELMNGEKTIELLNYDSGIYYFTIYNSSLQKQTYKVIKF
jgi:hypothetical protein